jgi:hypothetical protein
MVADWIKPPPPKDQEKALTHLIEEQVRERAFRIIKCLDGAPMGQAISILDEARSLLLDGHKLDTSNPRFQAMAAELGVSQLFCGDAPYGTSYMEAKARGLI